MWWIIIIAAIVIVALAFWMMSGKKEVDEPVSLVEESTSPAEEPEIIAAPEVEPESSDEKEPTMQ